MSFLVIVYFVLVWYVWHTAIDRHVLWIVTHQIVMNSDHQMINLHSCATITDMIYSSPYETRILVSLRIWAMCAFMYVCLWLLVCMCVCVCVCMCVCVCLYVHWCIAMYMWTYLCVYVYVSGVCGWMVHARLHKCICMWLHAWFEMIECILCIYECMCVCMYVDFVG